MVILLYGQDTYRSREKLKKIVEHYQKIHKSGLNLKFYNGQNLNFEDFKDEFRSTSMLKEKKLMILENSFSNSEFKEKFLKEGKIFTDSGDIILFYEEKDISEKDNFTKFLKEKGKCQKFELLEGQKLKNWLRKEFGKYQAKIEPSALEKFVSFVGSNLWQASNEIKKLVSYKKAENSSPLIKAEDVELLVKPEIETDIFATIDAISSKNKKRALSLIHKHLKKGDSPLYLLAMINFQFRNLLQVKENPYGQFKMHPFAERKAKELAGRFSLLELKKIYQKIFQADLNIKTGRLNPETALDLLIAEI